jgi:predicted dehydrogenase
MNRRKFLWNAGTMVGLGQLAFSAERPPASSGTFTTKLGIIGLGPQGRFLTERFRQIAQVLAVCDVQADRLSAAVGKFAENPPKGYARHEEFLAHPGLEAVVIATPDHWLAPLCLAALKAGKHVYLEAPVCRNLIEARALLSAAASAEGIVQVGAVGRANAAALAAARYIRSGKLGVVGSVEGWSVRDPSGHADVADSPVPPGLDWDRWLGPLAERPYRDALFNGGWRHDSEIGGGYLRFRGMQQFGLLPWLLGTEPAGVVEIKPLSGPGTRIELAYQFENGLSVLWTNTDSPDSELGWGMNFTGSTDTFWLHGGDGGCAAETRAFSDEMLHFKVPFDPRHRENWLEAVESRKHPSFPLSKAVVASALAIAGGLSWSQRETLVLNLEVLRLETGHEPRVDYRAPWRITD